MQYFSLFVLGGVLVLVHEWFWGENETFPKTSFSGG